MIDPWLPKVVNSKITTNHYSFSDAPVSSLFSIGEKAWDVDITKDLYNERDTRCIFDIPLSTAVSRDYRYWFKEKSGTCSVKSSYKFLQEGRDGNVDEGIVVVWKKFWKLKFPKK